MRNVRIIQPDIAYDFRSRHSKKKSLIKDDWDFVSKHYGFYGDGKLKAVLRETPALNNRLPLSNYFPEIKIGGEDVELSMLLVDKNSGFKTVHDFFRDLSMMFTHTQSKVYIDAIVSKGIRIENYKKLGFAETKYARFDKRYSSESIILVRKPINK